MYDAVVVGGGVAGLSAALILGRARRRVLVLDGGAPRNEPAAHAHGFVTRDGTPPLELLRLGREELGAYPSVEVRAGEVTHASTDEGTFSLTLADGETVEARKLVLATGVTDMLPEIPGMQELWGRGVHHCPYCHGWEVRDKRWGILGDAAMAFERVALFRAWTDELILLANGATSMDAAEQGRLLSLGVSLDERRIARIESYGEDEVAVAFDGGPPMILGAIFVLPHQIQRSPLAETLGCELAEAGPTRARFVKVDAATGETTVPGVFAAGDMTGPAQSLILAAASGARAAYKLNYDLATEDAERRLVLQGSV